MNIEKKVVAKARGVRFEAKEKGQVVGRVFLYILHNDLHEEPFGLLEDLFVVESSRKKGIGRKLVEEVIAEARAQACYKLLCTSRYGKDELHSWYESFGFTKHGIEFRLNF
jgi:GNAT superfamily N-acetyltransferase